MGVWIQLTNINTTGIQKDILDVESKNENYHSNNKSRQQKQKSAEYRDCIKITECKQSALFVLKYYLSLNIN